MQAGYCSSLIISPQDLSVMQVFFRFYRRRQNQLSQNFVIALPGLLKTPLLMQAVYRSSLIIFPQDLSLIQVVFRFY